MASPIELAELYIGPAKNRYKRETDDVLKIYVYCSTDYRRAVPNASDFSPMTK